MQPVWASMYPLMWARLEAHAIVGNVAVAHVKVADAEVANGEAAHGAHAQGVAGTPASAADGEQSTCDLVRS